MPVLGDDEPGIDTRPEPIQGGAGHGICRLPQRQETDSRRGSQRKWLSGHHEFIPAQYLDGSGNYDGRLHAGERSFPNRARDRREG